MSKTQAEYNAEYEAWAAPLAAEGRAGQVSIETATDREAITRTLIRKAFWNLEQHKRFPGQAPLSDDANFALVIRYVVQDAIESEHDRIAAIMRKALLEITGDDDDALY